VLPYPSLSLYSMLLELSAAGKSDSAKVFGQIFVFTPAVAGPSVWRTELNHFLEGNEGTRELVVAYPGVIFLCNKCHHKISQSEHLFTWNTSKGQLSSA